MAENVSEYGCCDACSPVSFDGRLNVLELGAVNRRKRRRAIRTVTKDLIVDLKAKLVAVREEVLSEKPAFRMVGIGFLCPDSTIDELYKQAKYIDSVEDVSLFGIRSELKEKFFKAISDTCSYVFRSRRQRL